METSKKETIRQSFSKRKSFQGLWLWRAGRPAASWVKSAGVNWINCEAEQEGCERIWQVIGWKLREAGEQNTVSLTKSVVLDYFNLKIMLFWFNESYRNIPDHWTDPVMRRFCLIDIKCTFLFPFFTH